MNDTDILAVFDAHAADFEFPGFNNAHYETVDARMHLFRTDEAWALLIEEAVDWLGADGPMTLLFASGPLVADGQSGLITPFDTHVRATLDEDGALEEATLRGKPVALEPVRARAEELGHEESLTLMICLSETARAELFHTVDELRVHLVPTAQHVLTIERWCHPDVYGGPKPSESEAFTQVAQVLASGDVSAYAPTEKPNSDDWKMWLENK